MLGNLITARLCACRYEVDDADGGLSTVCPPQYPCGGFLYVLKNTLFFLLKYAIIFLDKLADWRRDMTSKKNKGFLIKMLVVVIATIFAVLITVFRIPGELEIIAEDSLYQKPSAISNKIKIIAIDETTLEALGPYTEWNRRVFAELIEKLNADPAKKPEVIGIDVIFSGTNDSEEDKRFAKAVEESGNVILASKLDIASQVIRSPENGYSLEYYVKEEITAYEALNSVSEPGFTNLILDDDGFVRRAYTHIASEDKTYKSFAYLIAEKLLDNPEKLSGLPAVVEIKYSGNPGDYETIPMSKVLDGTVPVSFFSGSTVLIGAYEEGMLDSYRVPINHSASMYGVECHANAISAFLDNKLIETAPLWFEAIISGLIAIVFGLIMTKCRIYKAALSALGIIAAYLVAVFIVFSIGSIKLSVIFVPVCIVAEFLAFVIVRYVELQKKRANDMQKMLFSMADCMAEAIEGRTPYNANHTKNVARRCMEMLDYINKMHKEKRTDMHFSEGDKKQLYLAAMLHDIGKMDVPLEVMDKPTKLGHREDPLRSRLEIIKLRLMNDILSGAVHKDEAEATILDIDSFLSNLGGYNCGRPLKPEEWEFVDKICASTYRSREGEEIPFLTEEEISDLHIKAGTLSDNERTIMQSHVVYTDKILGHMHFGKEFRDVREMAANHHELLNAKGYPKGIGAEKLDTMTRILTIMDIYDSLIADDRPYKKAKPNDIAFKILDEEADFGKIDKELLSIAKEIWFSEKAEK